MDPHPNAASVQFNGLVVALALTIAILGAEGLSNAAGFPETQWGQGPARPLCLIVLFALFWMLLRFLFQLGFQVASRLSQVRERPVLPITITLLACGTLCVLGALALVWHDDGGSLNMSPGVNVSGNVPGVNMGSHVNLSVQTSGSLTRPLAMSAALLIGVALLALGVWSSLAPPAATVPDRF
jgi:hypothetical protein